MFAITICFGPAGTMWRLMFKTEEAVRLAGNKLRARTGERTEIADDFGQTLLIEGILHGCMIEDLDQSKLAHVEAALHTARTQQAAQKQADSDPQLRLMRASQGPAVLTQMPNGRWSS